MQLGNGGELLGELAEGGVFRQKEGDVAVLEDGCHSTLIGDPVTR